jgi:hypothetical protein
MKNVTKENAVQMIKDLSAGTIYSVLFVKKDGTERLMNSIKGTKKGVNGEGLKFDPAAKALMPVYDLQLAKSGVDESKCWRMINFDTVKQIKTNGETYLVG